jgi:hypothetical protein
MRMKDSTRHVLAISAGVLVFAAAALFAYIGGLVLSSSLGGAMGSEIPDKQALYPAQYGNIFYQLAFLGLALVAGFSTTLMLWSRGRSSKRRGALYFCCLVLILPLTAFNYASGDWFIRASVQVFINLGLIFLGCCLLLMLLEFKPTSTEMIVLRGLAIFILVFAAIAQPALYSVVWYLVVTRAVKPEPISLSSLSTVAGFVSAIVAVLNYRHVTKPSTSTNSSVIKP